ncbi:hypothetical protein RJ639_046998 [Escallonia herrerae]|uniref:Retrovirus-related Pol polyprotein from transposon TNT 1-94-like beta-barrel domain-containing protein n=1 Tax=Escallonia herrerae TaxID=1293975 RepID=A0AA88WBA5_9ASTE|nr:hypothetical protein RJ639_046998 [Escallonia herrerae]
MNANEWAILDRKALATVRLSLTSQVAFSISNERSTAGVMQALEKLYEKPSASNEVFLMERLFNMRMSENGSVVDHLYDFNCVTNQLESVGINFDDEIRALLYLNGYRCSVVEKEKVKMKLSNGGTLVLKDVRHISELQKKLISISGLDREGYFVTFGEKQWKDYMELDEPEDGQAPGTENPEVLDETTDLKIGAGDQQQVPETPNLRSSARVRKAPDRPGLLLDYILYTDSNEPEYYQEAIQDESRLQWEQAMNDEMDSFEKNQTY